MSENISKGSGDFKVNLDNVRMVVTAYTNSMKIVGNVYMNINTRSTARRPSDLLRNRQDRYMTLSDAKLYKKGDDTLVEELPYIVINLDLVEILHADELAD